MIIDTTLRLLTLKQYKTAVVHNFATRHNDELLFKIHETELMITLVAFNKSEKERDDALSFLMGMASMMCLGITTKGTLKLELSSLPFDTISFNIHNIVTNIGQESAGE